MSALVIEDISHHGRVEHPSSHLDETSGIVVGRVSSEFRTSTASGACVKTKGLSTRRNLTLEPAQGDEKEAVSLQHPLDHLAYRRNVPWVQLNPLFGTLLKPCPGKPSSFSMGVAMI